MDDLIPLPDVPRELKRLGARRTTYQQLYKGVLDGDVPAERGSNNRWQVRKADLPEIARNFGANADAAVPA